MSKNILRPKKKHSRHAEALATLYASHLCTQTRSAVPVPANTSTHHPLNEPGGHRCPMRMYTNSAPPAINITMSTNIPHFNIFLACFHCASRASPSNTLRRLCLWRLLLDHPEPGYVPGTLHSVSEISSSSSSSCRLFPNIRGSTIRFTWTPSPPSFPFFPFFFFFFLSPCAPETGRTIIPAGPCVKGVSRALRLRRAQQEG